MAGLRPGHPAPGLPVSDDTVVLRPLEQRDRTLLAQARSDATITYRFGPQRMALDDQIRHFIDLYESGRGGALTITPHGADPVGAVFIEGKEAGSGDVGYWVLPHHRGHGYARRGLRLAARWALTALGWARLQLWIEPDNASSLRVAEDAGFIREGVLRSYGVIDGRRCDAVFFSLLPADLAEPL